VVAVPYISLCRKRDSLQARVIISRKSSTGKAFLHTVAIMSTDAFNIHPPSTPDSMRPGSAGSNRSRNTLSVSEVLGQNMKEEIVKIRNFLLLKYVTENNDKELNLVATCKQELSGLEMDEQVQKLCDDKMFDMGTSTTCRDIETLSKRLFFDYRLNDLTADEASGWIKTRRVEMNSTKARKTFQMNAPLEVDEYYNRFPFKIVTASVMIELSSSAIRDQRRRPNLLLAKEHKAMNVVIQNIKHLKERKTKDEPTETDIKMKMDRVKSYDFVTPFPEVTYQYDKKKKYCPKFKVTFYMVESGTSKFVQIVFPMLLIAILNTVQVLDRDFVENTNYLNNAATFALTAVFILPSIISESNTQDLITMNNTYIILIFVGLALSSIPAEMMGTNVPALTGMIVIWISFIMPIIGCFGYFQQYRSIRRASPEQTERYDEEQERESVVTTTVDKASHIYKRDPFDKFIIVHG